MMFNWLKLTRENDAIAGRLLHLGGLAVALSLSVFWWRAWLHLAEGVEPLLETWSNSGSLVFGWVPGIGAFIGHAASEPMIVLEIAAIFLVGYLSFNRVVSLDLGDNAERKPHGSGWFNGFLWGWLLSRR